MASNWSRFYFICFEDSKDLPRLWNKSISFRRKKVFKSTRKYIACRSKHISFFSFTICICHAVSREISTSSFYIIILHSRNKQSIFRKILKKCLHCTRIIFLTDGFKKRRNTIIIHVHTLSLLCNFGNHMFSLLCYYDEYKEKYRAFVVSRYI